MGKLKTHKITAKKFKTTKSGKLAYKAAGRGHLKSKKDARIKYRVRGIRILSEDTAQNIRKLLPNK